MINVYRLSHKSKGRASQIGHFKRSNNILFTEDTFTTKEYRKAENKKISSKKDETAVLIPDKRKFQRQGRKSCVGRSNNRANTYAPEILPQKL